MQDIKTSVWSMYFLCYHILIKHTGGNPYEFYQRRQTCLCKTLPERRNHTPQICHENQIPRSTFYRWIQGYQQTVTDTDAIVTPQEFLHLKRRVKTLEDMIQILKKVNCTVSSPLQEKLKTMEALSRQFSVHTLIFRNKRDNTLATKRREELKVQIQKIYDDSEQIYGAGKITVILRNQGMKTSEKYVSELMKELGISSVSTTAKREHKKWEKGKNRNLLQQQIHTTGRLKFGLAILPFSSLTISIIISVLSLICLLERLFPIESLRIAVHNYSLKRLSKPILRENRKRDLCFTVTGGHSIFLTHLSAYWKTLE